MKRKYEATGVRASDKCLSVYVTVHVGQAIRFIRVEVPWTLVASQHREIVEGMEQVFVDLLKERWEQPPLPLETWE